MTHQPKVEKTNIVFIGDLMIKNVSGRDVSCRDSIKIRLHPGASTEDLVDQIKPAIREKPDILVIHIGTNDLQNNCSIAKKAKKQVGKEHSVKTAFCRIIICEDEDFQDSLILFLTCYIFILTIMVRCHS